MDTYTSAGTEDKNKITVRIPSQIVEDKEWIEQLFYENIF